MRSSSHELAKIHMQNQESRQVFGVDDLQRQQDQTERAYDMASYLRLQIAQRLMNIENEREENISVQNYIMNQMEERELIYQQRA
jgi:hypothetical protein